MTNHSTVLSDGFERYYDPLSGANFREAMKERIREFQMAIQRQGYEVAPKFKREPHMDTYQIDCVQGKISYGFFVTDTEIEYRIYRQIG